MKKTNIHKKVKKGINYIIIGTLSCFLSACSTSDFKNMLSSGSAVSSTDTQLVAIKPQRVRLYFSNNEVTKKYKIIGRVSAENYNIVGIEHSQESIMNELKKQAASLGANAIMNISNNLTQTTAEAISVR